MDRYTIVKYDNWRVVGESGLGERFWVAVERTVNDAENFGVAETICWNKHGERVIGATPVNAHSNPLKALKQLMQLRLRQENPYMQVQVWPN